jgi:transketolase
MNALFASERLEEDDGINIRILDMHTIKPIDKDAILKAASETGGIITVEDHNVIGGLGSAVAEVLADNGVSTKFRRLGVPDTFSVIGDPEQLHNKYGYDEDGIYDTVKEMLQK